MTTLSVFGAQWGDEGKGKIIDLLARDADMVVRYQGGANAGHTVVVGEEKFVLHLVPSGVLHDGKVNVIANGVAIDPIVLLRELEALAERGVKVDPTRLRVSAGAHVIFEHHQRMDHLAERWRGDGRIGTTGRGIGPAYADKAARTGLRIGDLIDPARLRERLTAALAEKNALFEKVHGAETLPVEAEVKRYAALGERLAPFVADTGAEVRDAHRAGKRILFEGAQGAMLDLDHGTYPYVTSSNTGTGGLGAGAGFPATKVDEVYGIAKAYCTRVGEGPFPSEEHGPDGEKLRELGNEYGATTGRPRRCGWMDLVALRYAFDLNGATGWVMTNLDVLSGFDEIPVVVAYEDEAGRRIDRFPAERSSLVGLRPVIERKPGWGADITGVRAFGDLPATTQAYVSWLEEHSGVPVTLLSVGPERDQVFPRIPGGRT